MTFPSHATATLGLLLAALAAAVRADPPPQRLPQGFEPVDLQWLENPKEAFVAGVVVDEQGEPIPGVEVEAFTPLVGYHSSFSWPTGRERFPGPARVTRTDAQGRFRLENLRHNSLRGHGKVLLSLRSKHRHVNDANYPLGDGVEIQMRGSGKPGVLRGRLIDATTGKPIASPPEARLNRRHRTEVVRRIDERGRFEIPERVTRGNRYLVYLFVAGYAATEARITAVDAQSGGFADIRLTPAPTLRGRLVDAQSGAPIAGAKLLYGLTGETFYFQWSDYNKYTDGYHGLNFVQHATTDADGRFWFCEPSEGDRGALLGKAAGYAEIVLEPGGRTTDPDTGELLVKLPRESVVTGLVLRDGEPLGDTRVSVSGAHRAGIEQWRPGVKTDAEGRFRYGGLAAGEYRVWADGMMAKIELGGSEEVTVELGRDAGIINISGRVPRGASVTFSPKFEWERRRITAEIDENGHYRATGLKPGPYEMRIDQASNGFHQDREETIDVVRFDQEFDLNWHGIFAPPLVE